jgi:hypothetical protein
VREALTDKRTYTIYPPSRWIAEGIKICAVSNFIDSGIFFGGWGVYEKGSKVLFQDM